MTTGEWLVLALACGAAVVGLLLAASNPEGATYGMGLGLFAAAVIYTGAFIKRHFDRTEASRH